MGLYKRRDSNKWWMAYSLDRKKVNESTHTTNRRIAQRALDRRLGEVAEGRLHLLQVHGAPKFREWSEQFLCSVSEPGTKKRYKTSVGKLRAFFGDVNLRDIASDRIDEFVEHRRAEKVRPATINRDLAVLRRMLRLAQKRRYIGFNPFEQVEMLNESKGRREARILSFAEEQRIEAVLPPGSFWIPLFRLLLETGLRVYSEALKLTWDDIDFENHVLRVRQSKTAAGIRNIPLSHHCEETLLMWRQTIENTSGFVFPSPTRKGKHLQELHRSWKVLLDSARVPDTWLHDLRATFASRLNACGLSLFQIAQLLGHSSGRIVGTYAKAFDEGKRQAIDMLDGYRQAHSSAASAQ